MVGRGKGGLEAAAPIFFTMEPLLHGTAASTSFTVVRPYRRRPRFLKDVSSMYLCSCRNCGVLSRLKLLRRSDTTPTTPPAAGALYPRHAAGREGRTPLNASDPPPPAVSSYTTPLPLHGDFRSSPFPWPHLCRRAPVATPDLFTPAVQPRPDLLTRGRSERE